MPVLTVNGAGVLLGTSFDATYNAIRRRVHSGILQQVNVGRRNRAFDAPDSVTRFTDLERRPARSVVLLCIAARAKPTTRHPGP